MLHRVLLGVGVGGGVTVPLAAAAGAEAGGAAGGFGGGQEVLDALVVDFQHRGLGTADERGRKKELITMLALE